MISPREIIAEMTIQEIGFKTLYHQLQDYIKISESEVQDFMSMGVKRPAAIKHVGYILNMKKHCPADFVPKKIEIVIPPRQLVMDITHKKTAKTKASGKEHFNFNRNSNLTTAEALERNKNNTKNRLFIKKLTKDLGGAKDLADRIRCNMATVYGWTITKNNAVFIPPKYVNKLLKVCKEDGLFTTIDDFLNMMPEQKRIYYWKTNWPISQS